MSNILMIAVGLALLVVGAELLVRCSASIAIRLGVSSLLIGLTIVAFGTSAPEAVASITASLRGSSGIAVGNIVGSNITNSLLVAGAAALVAPIAVANVALRRDGVVALLSAGAVWLICGLQMLHVGTGIALLLALCLYVVFAYRQEKNAAAVGALRSKGAAHGEAGSHHDRVGRPPLVPSLAGAVVGLALLLGGGQLLVTAAINMADSLGVSEAVIGLTIVAVGTSLPELATSLLAARRGEAEIAFGNVLGSNIFNALGIGGLTAFWSKDDVPIRIVIVDFPIMLTATALLLLVSVTGRRVGRLEGAMLIGAFSFYLASVWL